MTVLLATDGSDQAKTAEQLVASIRWPRGTRIEVVRVYHVEPIDLEMPADAVRALREVIGKEIDAHLAAVKKGLSQPGREIGTRMLEGRPASAVVEEARRLEADLVVVGSRGRGEIASAVLGSVAAEVVDWSPCPVLVARAAKLSGVVVADDGSDGSAEAEEVVGSWTFLRGLPVRVVSVASLVPFYGLDTAGGMIDAQTYQLMLDGMRELHRGYADEGVKRLGSHGIAATREVREGSAAAELIAAAASAKADLIVVGSRGRTGLARLITGSVARNVLLHAPVSVLMVRQKVALPPAR